MGMQRGKQVLYFRLLTEKGQGFGEEKKELQQGSKNKLCFFDEHVVKISIDDGAGSREGGRASARCAIAHVSSTPSHGFPDMEEKGERLRLDKQ